MIIGLFGGSGQLGRALQRDLAPLGEVLAPTRLQLDLSDVAAVQQWLQQNRCDLLVNAAAMTQVDVAETSVELAMQLNQYFVQQLAEYAAAHNIWLVHFSTDYVFDGSGEIPWCETDECRPLQIYGRSKRAGELAIQASGCQHLLIRTSWLYDSQGQNFLLTMLRLARQSTAPLKIVSDQIGAPTYAPQLSAVVQQMLQQLLQMPPHQATTLSGIYHLCATGYCSWLEFATAIFAQAKAKGLLHECQVIAAISSSELARPAARPKNSRLNTDKVQTTFNLQLTGWQQQLAQCLDLLKNSAKTGK
ncbi:dTDP-4-dehydrorhamnose reductase [Rheinheimera sp. SA_1]|uniref:dTDP-4-dehydrorhamnose reductase n=1 Tax=Rheinheimera sp. SA_1 TaxID=1827365 RepID=UPI000800A404|nr:dTDP-4-dehydrorhamnose reductase [Rheinheimera sp. SA_1]OBP14494.1 dTDP-4-dehydrorhamnose reductase [Rheinheimera sp. SA_1]